MSEPETLRELVEAAAQAGYFEDLPAPDADAAFAVGAESYETVLGFCKRGSRRGLCPLAERGLLTWFDAEGAFYKEGAHAKFLEYLFKRMALTVAVTEHWLDGVGLLLHCCTDSLSTWFLTSDDSPYRSDYAELATIVEVTNHFARLASNPYRILNLDSEDQSAALVIVPNQWQQRFAELLPTEIPGGITPEEVPTERAEALLVKQ